MLVLSRKIQERVYLTLESGETVVITVVDIERGKIRLGVDAPGNVIIEREEVRDRRLNNGEK